MVRDGGHQNRKRIRELRAENARLLTMLNEINAATFSHVDGRDLLGELHPRRSINITVRIDAVETTYEGDWLSNLYVEVLKARKILDDDEVAATLKLLKEDNEHQKR